MAVAERMRSAGHWRLNRAVTSWLAAAVLTGCAAGPDFLAPASPHVTGYTSVPLPAQTASAATLHGEPQRVGVGRDIGASWWQALGSPRLDTLIEQALKSSPTLASAEATLRQAREWHAAQAGSTLYPRVDANAGAQRQRTNPSAQGQAGAGHEFSLFSASIGVRYRLDLSGGNQRALEALAARSEHRRYQLEGARLSLAGAIAQTAIARARLSGQVAAMQVLVQMQEEQLDLTRQRVRLGQAAGDEVLALQAQLEQMRAGMPALRKQLEHSEHLLAVLAGQAPGAATVPELMGRRYDDTETQKARKMVSYNIVEGPNHDARVQVPIKNKSYTPQEISAMVLGKLKLLLGASGKAVEFGRKHSF